MTSASHTGSGQPVRCEIQGLITGYVSSGCLVEIVYRDEAGQMQVIHDVVRDLFSRAGREFVIFGRGLMVSLDHVVTLDGHLISRTGVA